MPTPDDQPSDLGAAAITGQAITSPMLIDDPDAAALAPSAEQLAAEDHGGTPHDDNAADLAARAGTADVTQAEVDAILQPDPEPAAPARERSEQEIRIEAATARDQSEGPANQPRPKAFW